MKEKSNTIPFHKFMGFPAFVGLQAMLLLIIAPFVPFTPEAMGKGLLVWSAFQAWAMYFMGGCTIKMAIKTMVGYIGGIIASVILIELGGLFGSLNTSAVAWGGVVAVSFVAFLIIPADRVPAINFLPSYFIGSGAYFAIITYVQAPVTVGAYSWYFQVAVPLLVSAVLGLVFGWATVTFKLWFDAKLAKG
ncbi:Protein of unknown function [Mariniphaga anaerophila]|uniref:DUF1097 domain-containing protein n=1 Tax=Mariniphaga anaerophila TaxID=1484053 RepID=A0A1M4SSW2_9BACT|nr:DUF1097 domain-containing protein [Mariniphaga anaerophila]SHE35097.1 Protein of unknown function [Mariniphaga anaerophila]